ncbi:MAG: hypothetical protein JSU08_08615 [Acidobacteria bacterium]|nr:hypothetical protein [Acidobacteriota bacterium]
MDLHIGNTIYDLVATERNGHFVAHALRGEHRDRFGIETSGSSAAEALDRLTRWLEWQHAHTEALAALQQAERVYHRAMADAAFGASELGEASRAALEALNAARARLDEVRGRRP